MPREIVGCVTIAVLAGCGPAEPVQRRYTELVLAPSAGAAPTNAPPPFAGTMAGGSVAAVDVAVAWTAPEGWEEQAGSGMRLVTFRTQGHACTITSFPGDVGGVEANVRRWLRQLNVAAPAPGAFRQFIAQPSRIKSDAGLTGAIYDFRELVSPTTGDEGSMLAAVFEKGDARVFVKLTAPASVISAEAGRFEALCRSLR